MSCKRDLLTKVWIGLFALKRELANVVHKDATRVTINVTNFSSRVCRKFWWKKLNLVHTYACNEEGEQTGNCAP